MNGKLMLLALVLLTGAFPSFGQYSTDMLNAHNNVRANGPFGPNAAPNPPLTPFIWNTAVASTAASWAATCQFAHNPNRGFVGENIYASTFNPTPANIVSNWASEAQYYNLASNTCAAGQVCGHYTQIVWNSTTSIGCATQFCNVNSPFGGGNWYIAVCDYSPPGNYIGQKPYTVVSTPLPGTLQFSSSAYSVNENGVTATISVTRASGSGGAVSVQYATSNGTATAGQDYASASGTLSWADGDSSTKSFSVPITDDNLFESNETVNLSLSNPGGGATLGSPSTASLTIVDNDSQPTLSIANTRSGAEPSTAALFTVTLSAQPTSQVTVQYASANGTATAGSDYTAVSGTLTFPANTTTLSQTITVPTLDDSIYEGTESFNVGLSSPSGATISGVNPATGTVTDNEAQPTVSIARTAAGAEPSTANIFTVTLSGQSSSQVNVQYSSSNGTATAGSDYTAVSGTLTFLANTSALTQTITVPTLDDQVFEGTENFTVGLSNPFGATISGTNPATGSITDNESQPTFSINNVSNNEGSSGTTSFTFNVTLSGPMSQTASVNYSTANGTATAPTDYTAVPSTQLTFNPGDPLTKTVTVLVNGDTTVEQNETFFVNLSGAVNASISVSQGTGTILNDDSAAVRRTAFDYDGDGRTDQSVFRPSNNTWFLNRSQAGLAQAPFGTAGDVLTPADFTGDGKTDIAVFRPSSGMWYVLRSEDGTFYGSGFGQIGDIPAPADYDGDGKADVALYRPGSGTWYVQRSTAGFMGQQFGIAEDKPAIGDFDGDGKADISVYRPSTGTWYRLNSSNGTFTGMQFGASGDKIVPADYTGDGKTDVAVFRPSNGTWYILRSEDGSFYGSAFGVNGDIPTPGDYDGDGKTDLAVYRPSQGTWYMLQSSAGFSAMQFGTAEDKPTPSAFVY